jgi:hypothetical protein
VGAGEYRRPLGVIVAGCGNAENRLLTRAAQNRAHALATSAIEHITDPQLRRNRFDADAFATLIGEARHEAAALIRARRSTWQEYSSAI